jgi:hypothetical protein
MNNHPTIRPVTRVRIAMEPSPELRKALSAFPHHERDESFPLYATAQRIIPYEKYHTPVSRERGQVRDAKELLTSELAQRALFLTSPSELLQNADGSILRVYLNPDKSNELRALTDALNGVDTIEPPTEVNKLYADLAIGGLANEAAIRRAQEGLDHVLASTYRAQHTPSPFAKNAKLQVEHIPRYPLRQRQV